MKPGSVVVVQNSFWARYFPRGVERSVAWGNISRGLGSNERCYSIFELDGFLGNTNIDPSYVYDDESNGLERYLKDIVDSWLNPSHPEDAGGGNYGVEYDISLCEKTDGGFRCGNPVDEPPMRNSTRIILGEKRHAKYTPSKTRSPQINGTGLTRRACTSCVQPDWKMPRNL